MANTKKERRIAVSGKQLTYFQLINQGMTTRQVAKIVGRTQRSIQQNIQPLMEVLTRSPYFMDAWMRLHVDTVNDVVRVIQTTLAKKGKPNATMVKTAIIMARELGLMRPKAEVPVQPAVMGDLNLNMQTNNFVSAANAPIEIRQNDDEQFGSGAPDQLRRIAESLSGFKAVRVVDEGGKPEDTR